MPFRFRRSFAALAAVGAVATLSACGGGGSVAVSPTSAPTGANTFELRAVQGSPAAGPIDVYVYTTGALQPATPLISNLQYPAISNYLSLPTGSYTVSITAHGASSALETENVSGSTTGAQITVALAGQIGATTLQLQNFIEPSETAGTSALIVHHASPSINASIAPVGIGDYQATNNAVPGAAVTTQLFEFSLAAAGTSSGPATSDSVAGGEFFLAPIPSSIPSPLGFAAGSPGASSSTSLTSVVTSATLSGLATNLSTSGYGLTQNETVLAQDTGNTLPSGAHLSVFAVDSTKSAPGILIGTLDP